MLEINICTSVERVDIVRQIVGMYEVAFEDATEYDPACLIVIRIPADVWAAKRQLL